MWCLYVKSLNDLVYHIVLYTLDCIHISPLIHRKNRAYGSNSMKFYLQIKNRFYVLLDPYLDNGLLTINSDAKTFNHISSKVSL